MEDISVFTRVIVDCIKVSHLIVSPSLTRIFIDSETKDGVCKLEDKVVWGSLCNDDSNEDQKENRNCITGAAADDDKAKYYDYKAKRFDYTDKDYDYKAKKN